MYELSELEGDNLLILAADIIENGLDPLSLPAVIPSLDDLDQYIVVEGNRRVLALKALETPNLIARVLSNSQERKLKKLSKEYLKDPAAKIRCILFESREKADHWIWLRHTGQNDGKGLVGWKANEKDRFKARRGQRSPARQILDFVDRRDWMDQAARESDKGIITSVTRLVSNPKFRKTVGIDKTKEEIYALFPADEIGKSLTQVIEDLKLEKIQVGDIYTADDRVRYAENLPDSRLPDEANRLEEPVHIDNLLTDTGNSEEDDSPEVDSSSGGDDSEDSGNGDNSSGNNGARRRALPRACLIPRDCEMDITPPRINKIYNELRTLDIDRYTNSASVMLRVFVELSVDKWLDENNLMNDNDIRSKPLAKRIKCAAKELRKRDVIPLKLEKAMQKVGDSKASILPSTFTFNQYVHNEYAYPNTSELRSTWDELQPFVEALWI